MALVRCKEKCGKPVGRGRNYIRYVTPIGYPDTAAMCGIEGCNNPGLVWLDESEDRAYRSGERIFKPHSHAVRIRVE
jgi:hypothetical protein